MLTEFRELIKNSSPWTRLKLNGSKGFLDADAVKSFNRVIEKCKKVGLLLNLEGELEGFCRSISRLNKSEWLTEVLKRDIKTDNELADARAFITDLRALSIIAME